LSLTPRSLSQHGVSLSINSVDREAHLASSQCAKMN
jgi:hypothetical protein